MASTPDFLGLPAEMRLSIYGSVFSDLKVIGNTLPIVRTSNAQVVEERAGDVKYRKETGVNILFVNHLIRQEALPEFSANIHAGLHLHPLTGTLPPEAIKSGIGQFPSRTTVMLANIRYLDIGVYDLADFLPEVVKDAEGDLSALAPECSLPTKVQRYPSAASNERGRLARAVEQVSGILPNVQCITLHTTDFDRAWMSTDKDQNLIYTITQLRLDELFPKLNELRHLDLCMQHRLNADSEYVLTLQRFTVEYGEVSRCQKYETEVRACGGLA